MPLPACSQSIGDVDMWKRLSRFASSNDLEAEVEIRDTGLEVDLFQSMHIDFDNSGKAICWGIVVVVS